MDQQSERETPSAGAKPHERLPDQQIAQIVDAPPAVVEHALREGTRLTRPWRHGAVHGYLPSMSDHVVMAYYGGSQAISLQADGKRIASRTRPGTITLIPQGHQGHWDVAGPIEVSHVYLPASRLQACAEMVADGKAIQLLDRVAFEDPTAARIVELLAREAATPSTASSLFIEQAIDLLCTQLIRGHSSRQALAEPGPRKGLASWQVKQVLGYMQDNLDSEITLDQLAGVISLSRFHFCVAFRQATGMTPHEALVAQRMEAAKQRLANPALNITQVALSVGYGTPSSFAAAFRKYAGVTPTRFRQQS